MKNIGFLLLIALACVACHRANDKIIVDDTYYEYDNQIVNTNIAIQDATPTTTRIGANLDRDLVVETEHHVIQMVGNPGTKYKYYVWTGDKNATDPDVIVDRGTVMVRTDE